MTHKIDIKMMLVLVVIVIALVGLAAFATFGGYDAIEFVGHCVPSSSVCTGMG